MRFDPFIIRAVHEGSKRRFQLRRGSEQSCVPFIVGNRHVRACLFGVNETLAA